MKRILVTGGSGFVGSHVLNLLADGGFEVHVISSRTGFSLDNQWQWHQVNLLDFQQVESLIKKIKPTYLLHLAWGEMAPGKVYKSKDNYLWVQISLALIQNFIQYGGQRLVMAGSLAEYDYSYGYLLEDITPSSYQTPYAASKNALRLLVQSLSEKTGLSSCWGRITFIYGPGEHPKRLIPSVIISLLKDEEALCTHGEQFRDYLHVYDAARALVLLLESDIQGTINIASGQSVQVKEIVLKIAQKLGKPHLVRLGAIPFPDSEPLFIQASTEYLTNKVRWKPDFDLDSGLEDSISWWKNSLTMN
ncbi:NAD(P)-dependent oxidoreductase [Cytobacillus solani]|uniref:NAD-dependent epimerase/dehydratase family protein n=1 Tax=Cytobacillus solani TaxID=1637975 RepID=UPI002079FCED|nr:NAD(P)-dependent oxidoreductase [Cytobacillus solani]USK57220.1 NAD(P)-dependent oxidoreductase [Cytobacillus solani]